MNNKDAIEALTCGFLDISDIDPFIDSILEALNKQLHKPPMVEKYFYGKYYLCPSCGQRVNEGECCRNNECGQLINWSELE